MLRGNSTETEESIAPVVVHGWGRTGTTLLVRMLGAHPELAWFSQYQARWPGHASLAAVSRLADVTPAWRRFRSERWFPQPAEVIGVWDQHFAGFHDNALDWAGDVAAGSMAAFRDLIDATRRWQGKPGFLTKYTGYPRYEFVRSVIPDVRIVHIDRDPRAVVMSMIKQRWGFKHHPERWAAMSPIDRIDWATERLASWARQMEPYAPAVDYLSYRYEDLIADPAVQVRRMLADLGIPTSPAHDERLRSFAIVDPGETWRARVSASELAHLEALVAPIMEARGYRS